MSCQTSHLNYKNVNNRIRYIPYRPASAEEGPSKLFCAVADDFALGSALLYGGTNGAFLDATWRGMNQNYAPTTFLLGVDHSNHATPCMSCLLYLEVFTDISWKVAVLLSQDVQANTLELFLKSWQGKLKVYSKKIISGKPSNPAAKFY